MHRSLKPFLPIVVLMWTAVGVEPAVYVHHIQVSMDGHDNTSCLTNSSFPCETLGFVLENLNNSTNVSIRNGNYALNRNYNTSNLDNVAFVGLSESVKIECSKGVGLQFRFCNNVVFQQLLFEGCGRLEYSAPFQLNDTEHIYQFYSGISFTYCKDLAVENCTFTKSAGISLVLYDVGGSVNIIDSHFVNNTAKGQSSSLAIHETAGGILLHLTQFGSLYPFNDTKHYMYSDGNNYTFKGCIFTRNIYIYEEHNQSQETPQPFGHGAGLTAFFCGSATKNSLLVDSCHFYNNTGIWGGGIFTEFQDKAKGNALRIFDSQFIGNLAKHGGGAVRTGNDIKKYEENQQMENTVEHIGNIFQGNSADMGGAVSHYGRTYHPNISGEYKNWIHFTNCSFHRNIATIGAAISVALNNKNNWIEMGPEIPYCVVIANCTISHNEVNYTKVDQGRINGMGVVYSSKVPMILRGENTFQNNFCTALLLDNAPLKVFDITSFTRNEGNKGGALALYGMSRMIMTKGSKMNFTGNNASENGGAIYIEAPGPEVGPQTKELRRHECSIGYENEKGNLVKLDNIHEWDTNITFTANCAWLSWGGNSIYATTLQSCFLVNESIGNNSAFAWENITTFSGPLNEEISTDPVDIAVYPSDWFVAPGEVFNPRVKLLDERNSPVYGVIKINIQGKFNGSGLDSLHLIQFIKDSDNKSSSVIKDVKLQGKENSTFNVTISSVGGKAISRLFTQKFKNCYDGFEQKSDKDICSCMSNKVDMQEGVYNCSSDGKHVNLIAGYWGGQVKGKFVTYPCPQHYCNFSDSNYVYSYDKSTICADNRINTLCGKCKPDFTVSLGGEKCVKTSTCREKFKISWGIPIFIVVTPIVVLILLRINVDIFTSYLNSWLYFYQVLPFILKPETVMNLDKGMKGILDLASWRLPGVKLSCFVKRLDNIDKLGLNYFLPLYMLAILIVITLVARCSCNCYQRTNVFRAISSILVLCYTNLTLISFNAVRWVKLQEDFSVLYIEGSITDEHIPVRYYFLVVFAVIVILCFVVVFPLLLLFRPFFIKNCRFMTYFTPLYNIFQHCFQDHLGCFFSAYYFICRIALLVLTAALATPGPYQRCFTEILVFLTLVIFVYMQPYRNDSHLRWLNTVDTIILSFLCIMAFMSSAQNTEAAQKTINGMQLFIKILAWLPMLYLLGLIIIAIRYYSKSGRAPRDGYQDLDDPTSTSGT